jgi:hypothetical protein
MTDERFERTVRTWLRQGPESAPAWPIEAALVEVETTPQVGVSLFSWRIAPMSTSIRIAAVLVLAAAAALVAVNLPGSPIGGPDPTPTATAPAGTATVTPPTPTPAPPTPPPPTPPLVSIPTFDATFTSELHGFSLRYPAAWAIRRAERPWRPSDTVLALPSPTLDELGDGTVRFGGASQQLPEGWTPERWVTWYRTSYDPFRDTCVPFGAPQDTVTVGGHEGLINFDGCPLRDAVYPGGVVFDIYLVVDGRGYNFALDGAVDHAYLEAILATVTFEPVPTPGG